MSWAARAAPRSPLARCDDRALHEDVPAARESVGVLHPGFISQLLEECTNVEEMPHRSLVCGVLPIIYFEKNVDEGAAFEVIPLKPFVEEIEDGQQASLRSRSTL